MNPREELGLRLWLVSHEKITSGSPTEQFEICVSGAYFRGIWIPECGGHVTDRLNVECVFFLPTTVVYMSLITLYAARGGHVRSVTCAQAKRHNHDCGVTCVQPSVISSSLSHVCSGQVSRTGLPAYVSHTKYLMDSIFGSWHLGSLRCKMGLFCRQHHGFLTRYVTVRSCWTRSFSHVLVGQASFAGPSANDCQRTQ